MANISVTVVRIGKAFKLSAPKVYRLPIFRLVPMTLTNGDLGVNSSIFYQGQIFYIQETTAAVQAMIIAAGPDITGLMNLAAAGISQTYLNTMVASSQTPTPSFDFYVSSTIGNDAFSGRTPDTPKKTLTAVAALITAGKSLGIEKGSYFREMLTITAANVTIGTYNSGLNATIANYNATAKPVLDASNVVAAANITKTGGQTNVYQFTAHSSTSFGQSFSFFENGARLARTASIAACDALTGSFFAPAPVDNTDQTVYFHATGDTNGTSDGKTYEITLRDLGLEAGGAGASGLQVDGIICKRSLQNDGVFRSGGLGCYIKNCIFIDGSKHAMFVSDGATVENCNAVNTEGYDSHFIYYVQDATAAVGTTFRNCNAIGGYAVAEATTKYGTTVGFYCHSQTATIPVVNFINCYCENMSSAFGGEAVITNITGCRSNLVATFYGGYARAGNITNIINCFADQRYGSAYQQAQNDQRSLLQLALGTTNITGSVFLCNSGNFGEFIYSSDNGAIINLSYNTFACVNANQNFAFARKLTPGAFNINHCVFYGIQTIYNNDGGTPVPNITSNYNIFYSTRGAQDFKNGPNSYASFALWQASGQDINSFNTDPAFTIAVSAWSKIADCVITNANAVTAKMGAQYYLNN